MALPPKKSTETKKTAAKAKAPTVSKKATSKKPASKKAPVKKAAPKKTVTKTASKPTAPKAKPDTAARPTMAGLQSQLLDIEARLKKAQGQTQRRVKALTDDVTSLAAAQDSTTAAQRQALDVQLNALSARLSRDMGAVHAEVTRGLSEAMHNPTLDALQNAISESHMRLTKAERNQTDQLARINRSLADLALAVDARLSEEAKTRQAAMAAMKRAQDDLGAKFEQKLARQSERVESKLNLRMGELEAENAAALSSMGTKVVALAEDLNARAEDGEALIKERVNEIAINTQAELESFKVSLTRRLERIEENLRGTDSHVDRSVASLTARLEGLEYGLTSQPVTQTAETPAYPSAPAFDGRNDTSANQEAYHDDTQSAVPSAAEMFLQNEVGLMPETSAQEAPAQETVAQNYGATQTPYQDAFSPDAFAADAPESVAITPPVMPPFAPTPPPAPSPQLEPVNHQAVPYDPAAYAAPPAQSPASQHMQMQPQEQLAYQPPYQEPAQPTGTSGAQPNVPPQAGNAPPFNQTGFAGQAPYAQAPYGTTQTLPIEDMPLPYADPAYAEAGATPNPLDPESMEAARPGVFKSKKRKKTKAPKGPKAAGGSTLLTPRNMRLGAMVAGIGAVAIVASQVVMRPGADTPPSPFGEPVQMVENNPIQPGGPITINTEQPIGNYTDNKAVTLTPTAGTALEQSAASGDAVAQLQLGLSKLEAGATKEGVDLIRLAANQDQPAALYRLAKLYETGEGVSADTGLAFKLTERAAKGGNRIAMHDLANYYVEGRGGVEVNMGQAAKWFQEAAQRGVVDSQFNMGVLFDSGEGVDQNKELALYWYGVAAGQGDQTAVARMNVLRDELPVETVSSTDKRIASFKPQKIDPLANGIFGSGQASAKNTAQAKSGAGKDAVIKTQSLLAGLGYEVGSPDGAIGPKTRSAIISFERSNGLPETGRVNADLIQRLELAAGA